ncbi:metal ABC transporter ATP-binding protein [Streptomyces sp. 4N509B]|uniref:metal ABC transporter ATP-binding protein n=1 Tax=Streptomyces sp. 4N509B TaxID=3457413 RepID=UPI003FD628DA
MKGKEPAIPATTPATAPVVSLAGVTAELGGRPVLRGVDLTVRPGEVTALLGPNGSGKSTAVRAAVRQVPVTGGELRLFGTPVRRFRAWHRVGYVPQRSSAASGVPATVREVVSAGRLARRGLRPFTRADRAAVDRALELVGLADRAGDSVSALSGGQHQRVLVARALTGAPELLIMDEPLTGMDLASQRVLAQTLRAETARGTAVLVVLHELGPLQPLINQSVVLAGGRVERTVAAAAPEGAAEPEGALTTDPSCEDHRAGEHPHHHEAEHPSELPLQTGIL